MDPESSSRTRSFLTNSRLGRSILAEASSTRKDIMVPGINPIQKTDYQMAPNCQICFRSFSSTLRQHHCRVCALSICSACCQSQINKEKACDKCAAKYSQLSRENMKKEYIRALTGLAQMFLCLRNNSESELRMLQGTVKKEEELAAELFTIDDKIRELTGAVEKLSQENGHLEEEICAVRGDQSSP